MNNSISSLFATRHAAGRNQGLKCIMTAGAPANEIRSLLRRASRYRWDSRGAPIRPRVFMTLGNALAPACRFDPSAHAGLTGLRSTFCSDSRHRSGITVPLRFIFCRSGSSRGPQSLGDVSGWTDLATDINELYDFSEVADRVAYAAFE